MKSRLFCLAVSMFLLFPLPTPIGAGAPSIGFTSPPDGSVFLTGDVGFNGTSNGSDAGWVQTTRDDFDSGTNQNTSVEDPGMIRLAAKLFDDFSAGSIDTTRWDITTYHSGGITASETGGVLQISGTDTSGGDWMGKCSPLTLDVVSNDISADLVSFSGTGTGYNSLLTLWQDGGNYVLIGKCHDSGAFGGGAVTYIHYCKEGSQHFYSTGAAPGGPTSYRISYHNQTAYMYQDGVLEATQDIGLSQPRLMLMDLVRSSGDSISSMWDNVKCHYCSEGTFLSSVHDCGGQPLPMKWVNWSADIPPDGSVAVDIRSSQRSDMTGATDWIPAGPSQSSGLPDAGRYLQYRVALKSADGLDTPEFDEINITCHLPIAKVELSIDGQSGWYAANGTDRWASRLSLPDGNLTIWARATDVSGASTPTSIRVNVDTTPPVGTIIINKGAAYTTATRVSLQLDAADLSGVASMEVSNYPDLNDSSWRPFASTLTWRLLPGDGNRTVYARFKDAVGWESGPVNDSIILDTSPPTGSVIINGGAEFTRDPNVTLTLNATDFNGVSDMIVSNEPGLSDAHWVPYNESMCWTLYPGDDQRTVYARFRDVVHRLSPVSSDSILLDTTPPLVEMSINSGAPYTRSRNVTLVLNITENYWVLSMEVAPQLPFSETGWQDFVSRFDYVLPDVQGPCTLYARAQDAAGNDGPPGPASIILDSVAPVSRILPMASEVEDANISVGWEGNDSTSGIRWFDVQYRDGDGPWADWQTRTELWSAVFPGQEDHTYSFRVRAQDRAGNQEPYPEVAGNSIRVGPVILPIVEITAPLSNATVRGLLTVTGTSRHPEANRTVIRVMVRMDDDATWTPANGTFEWTFNVSTGKMKNGPHAIHAQAFDGERYSLVADRTFVLKKESIELVSDSAPWFLAILAIAIAAASWIYYYHRRQRGLDEQLSRPGPPEEYLVAGVVSQEAGKPPPV